MIVHNFVAPFLSQGAILRLVPDIQGHFVPIEKLVREKRGFDKNKDSR